MTKVIVIPLKFEEIVISNWPCVNVGDDKLVVPYEFYKEVYNAKMYGLTFEVKTLR